MSSTEWVVLAVVLVLIVVGIYYWRKQQKKKSSMSSSAGATKAGNAAACNFLQGADKAACQNAISVCSKIQGAKKPADAVGAFSQCADAVTKINPQAVSQAAGIMMPMVCSQAPQAKQLASAGLQGVSTLTGWGKQVADGLPPCKNGSSGATVGPLQAGPNGGGGSSATGGSSNARITTMTGYQ